MMDVIMVLFLVVVFFLLLLLVRCVAGANINNYLFEKAIEERNSPSDWYCEGYNVDEFIKSPKTWHIWTGPQAYRFYKERDAKYSDG